jgi:hypothetical protein
VPDHSLTPHVADDQSLGLGRDAVREIRIAADDPDFVWVTVLEIGDVD